MCRKVIFPRRYETATRCIDKLLYSKESRAYQSELKKVTCAQSWKDVVKREIEFINEITRNELDNEPFIITTPQKNPKTRKNNEILYQINPSLDVTITPKYYVIKKRTEETNMKEENKNKPLKTFDDWPINVTIWPNKIEPTDDKPERTFHSVTIERTYKNKEGKYCGTASLRKQDLLKTARKIKEAYDYILEVEKSSHSEKETTKEDVEEEPENIN